MRIHGFTSKNLLEDLDIAVELLENPYSFEYYCDACDNFNMDECPFKNKVSYLTEWKKLNCNKFLS